MDRNPHCRAGAGDSLVDTKNPRTGSRGAGASVSVADAETPTRNRPNPQPASVVDLRKAHLIARHVRPELASAIAVLVFGGAHG